MKICILASGDKLDSPVSPFFGRAPFFLIFGERGKKFESLQNLALEAMRGAGVMAAQEIAQKGVGAVIVGDVGPHAFYALESLGIKALQAQNMTVEEALKAHRKGELNQIKLSTSRNGFQQKGLGGRKKIGRGT